MAEHPEALSANTWLRNTLKKWQTVTNNKQLTSVEGKNNCNKRNEQKMPSSGLMKGPRFIRSFRLHGIFFESNAIFRLSVMVGIW